MTEQRFADRRVSIGILVSREPVTLRPVGDSDGRAAWAARVVARIKAVTAELYESFEAPDDPTKQMWRVAADVQRLQGRGGAF